MTTLPGSTTYYAIVHPRFTREWPSGLVRRTEIAETGRLVDEDWTGRKQWEPSTFFLGPQFGDFSQDGIPYVEVEEAEAERIRLMPGVRPRGGPFTEAGQRWLAEHPDDPAAKYLGVSGPEYDSAGRLVRAMGPVSES